MPSPMPAETTAVELDGQFAAARVPLLLDLLLTVGYIDGVFHERERAFVEHYLESAIRFTQRSPKVAAQDRERARRDYRAQLHALDVRLNAEIAELKAEVAHAGPHSYVATRLKVRALQIFGGFTAVEQAKAIELMRSLMIVDGRISEEEQGLFDELMVYFAASQASHGASQARSQELRGAPMTVMAPQLNPLKAMSHTLLDPLEHAYSPLPMELQSQLARDQQLVGNALAIWDRQRALGNGRLTGVTDIAQVPRGAQFLDGHVHVLRPDQPTELVVLGDLHGCYGCLKAALLQSDFIRRAWAHQWDPANHPDIKLVLLGDYIDRGRFSFDGVMRAALQLFTALPDHVILLRGNHEYFLRDRDRVFSGVAPAEAIASLAPHVAPEQLDGYRILFEQMPSSFLCERTLLVHGGIPREDTFAAKYQDLSSLNDPELRFQMMWSDPSQVDQVPVRLQRANPRFSFGRQQFSAFMERTGMRTMVRGHEQIDQGFATVFDLGERKLLNVFSAGGRDNRDLPTEASYRSVTPMALTICHGEGAPVAVPWPIEYQPFNCEPHNGFHRAQPTLEFRRS